MYFVRIFTGFSYFFLKLGPGRGTGFFQPEEIRSPHRVVGSWVARIFHSATALRQGRSYPRIRVWVRPLRLPFFLRLPFVLRALIAAYPALVAAQAGADSSRAKAAAKADSARTRADSTKSPRSPADTGRVTEL